MSSWDDLKQQITETQVWRSMPTFGLSDEEATAIVEYFEALEGYELGPVVLEAREEAHTAVVAHREQPEQFFDCYSCHPRAGHVDEHVYTVAHKALSGADVHSWMVENLGLEDTAKQTAAAPTALPSAPAGGAN